MEAPTRDRSGHWMRFLLEKWAPGRTPADGPPDEVIEGEENILANAGMDILLNLGTGQSGTAFSNANARIGVGDSSTAAARTQTDLQAATNKFRKAMESGFPTAAAENDATNGRSVKFKSSFADGEANFAWNEFAVFNAGTGGAMLNRKVQSLGTKSGGVWNLTVEVSLQ